MNAHLDHIEVSPKHVQNAVSTDAPAASGHELSMRALVSTKEAGIIIGKGGATIASLRQQTGVKAGVSKVVPGVQDRVFSAAGDLDSVSSAYGEIARLLLETPLSDSTLPPPAVSAFTSIRLLISHNLIRSQDQADPGYLGSPYGCEQGNATSVDGASGGGPGWSRGNQDRRT